MYNKNAGRSSVLLAALAVSAYLWAVGTTAAMAAPNDVFAISCPGAIHVADFQQCIQTWEFSQGKTGLAVASNPTAAASAFAKISGTYRDVCAGKGSCSGGGSVRYVLTGSMTFVKPDGTPIATDADLVTADQQIFAQLRNSPPIKIPPNYGTTPLGNDAFAVDTNTGINVAYPGNPGLVPVGTIVLVKWQDGSTALFIRTNSTATLLWAYIVGTAKDANGNPINPRLGTYLQNPHSGGAGSGAVVPQVPPGYYLNLQGGANCTWRASQHDHEGGPDDGLEEITIIGFGPC